MCGQIRHIYVHTCRGVRASTSCESSSEFHTGGDEHGRTTQRAHTHTHTRPHDSTRAHTHTHTHTCGLRPTLHLARLAQLRCLSLPSAFFFHPPYVRRHAPTLPSLPRFSMTRCVDAHRAVRRLSMRSSRDSVTVERRKSSAELGSTVSP